MSDIQLTVEIIFDDEAKLWVATSDDIPGLVTEATTVDLLIKRILLVAPELLQDNAHHFTGRSDIGGLLDICVLSKFKVPTSHAN